MRLTEALRCLVFAGLTAAGPWLAHSATTVAGVPTPLAWSGVLLAVVASFAWMVRGDLRSDAARNPQRDEAWPGPAGAEQREA